MGNTDLRRVFSYIEDIEIQAFLADCEDLPIRFAALSELLRNAKNLDDVREFEEEIDDTIGVFLLSLIALLPGDKKESARYIFELWDLRRENDPASSKKMTKELWRWPLVQDLKGVGGFHGEFREFSALKMFGYTVGKTAGWSKKERQSFLRDFMCLELPDIVTEHFGDMYGEPLSTTRLRAVATFLANCASLRLRSDPVKYEVAIRDWTEDLDFLRSSFYEGMGLKFHPWPEISDDKKL